jgi:hypothetical protein
MALAAEELRHAFFDFNSYHKCLQEQSSGKGLVLAPGY